MTIQEFREYMASGQPVVGGSDVHMMFHQLSQEALRITAEINGKYHTPEELHTLLEELWGRCDDVDGSQRNELGRRTDAGPALSVALS